MKSKMLYLATTAPPVIARKEAKATPASKFFNMMTMLNGAGGF